MALLNAGTAARAAGARRRSRRASAGAALWLGAALLGAAPVAGAASVELSRASVADIGAAYAAGTLSAEQLVSLYLQRIQAYDQAGPRINAVIALNPHALDEARALDRERRQKGPRGPLHGIPVVVKDNIDTVEMPTTGGSFVLAGAQPQADAPIIRRLREAGAIILAKVNLDDFAAGGAGFSSIHGQTRNPYDPDFTPLGSSGGSGAALAAWLAPLALGTDTGGSLRSPSSVGGVYGLKPTRGLLSRDGIIPTCYSYDAAGPMARHASDLAAMLGPMTGYEPGDADTADSLGKTHRDYRVFLGRQRLDGLRIGVLREGSGADADVDAAFAQALERLRKLGAELVDVAYPPQVVDPATRRAIVKVVCDTEKAVYFDAYLGRLAPGYPKTLAELAERGLALRAPQGTWSPYPVVYEGLAKRVTSGQGMSSLAYRSAREHGVAMVADGVLGVFEQQRVDVLVYPTRPRPPHRIIADEPLTGRGVPPPPPGVKSIGVGLTNIGNITGFPDLVAPAGLSRDGLPISISFVGPAFSEPLLIGVADAYEHGGPPLPLPTHTPPLPGERFRY